MKRLVVALFTVVAIVCSSCVVLADTYQDFLATRITHVYTNVSADGNSGYALIRISDAHGSPEGFLALPGSLNSPMTKGMFLVANLAQITQKTCWIRVIPQASGCWIVNIIQISP